MMYENVKLWKFIVLNVEFLWMKFCPIYFLIQLTDYRIRTEFVTGIRDWPTLDHCTVPQGCRAWYISPRDCSPVQTSGPPGFYFWPPTSQKPLGMSGYSSYGPCLSIIQEKYVQIRINQIFISVTNLFNDPVIGFKHFAMIQSLVSNISLSWDHRVLGIEGE